MSKGLNEPGTCDELRENYEKRNDKDLIWKTATWNAPASMVGQSSERYWSDCRIQEIGGFKRSGRLEKFS